MGNEGAEAPQQIGHFYMIGWKEYPQATTKDFALVFFPGEEIGGKSNKQEEGQQEKNGSRDLMGTLVFDKLFCGDPGGVFFFQPIRNGLLALL